jgi:parallel beta-helix repeat protein
MDKRFFTVFILVFLMLLTIVPPVTVKAQSKTIVVPDDYPTIQAAIDHANAGDTVFVKKGTYYHDGPTGQHIDGITIDKSLSLIGEDSKTTILKPCFTNSNYLRSGIHVTADNVIISGFTIDGIVNNFTIRHTELDSWSYQESGILIQMGDNGTHVPYGCKIIGNIFFGSDTAIEDYGNSDFISQNNATNGISVNLWNTIVSGNNITGIGGIMIGGSDISSKNVTIKQNNIFSCGFEGIELGNLDGPTYIYQNNITGCNHGIEFRHSNNCFVYNNNIMSNGLGVFLPNQLLTKRVSTLGIGNRVYYNNFIDNNKSALVGSAYSYYPPDLNKTDAIGNGTATVSWDNGVFGNYWSDYAGQGSYFIDQNNVDHYPLTRHVDISTTAPTIFTALIPIGIIVVVVVVVSAGLLVYQKKRKR